MSSGYPYASGKIRALEPKLLKSEDLDRMIEAPDAESAFKVFNDLSYADELQNIDDPKDYALVLDHDLKQTKDLLLSLTPNQKLTNYLFARFDWHNIKLFFKEKYLGKDLTEDQSLLGAWDAGDLRTYILEGKDNGLPVEAKTLINALHEQLGEQPNSELIDRIADTMYFTHIQTLAGRLRNRFISELTRLQIDMAQIKILLRSQGLGLETEEVLKRLLRVEGFISRELLVSMIEENFNEEFIKKLLTQSHPLLSKKLEVYSDHLNLWKLEKLFEETETEFTRQTKYMSYGPEIVVAYFLARKNAIRNLRLVMIGKNNNIEPQVIRQRMRELF